ncbi:hypothetical protein V8F20_007298 [Naviculisporaceae sp. PSN 640]
MESLSIFCLNHLSTTSIVFTDLIKIRVLQSHITTPEMTAAFVIQASVAFISITFFRLLQRLRQKRELEESTRKNFHDSIHLKSATMRAVSNSTNPDSPGYGDTAIPSYILGVATRIFESRPVTKLWRRIFDRSELDESKRRAQSFSDLERDRQVAEMENSRLLEVDPVDEEETARPPLQPALAPAATPESGSGSGSTESGSKHEPDSNLSPLPLVPGRLLGARLAPPALRPQKATTSPVASAFLPLTHDPVTAEASEPSDPSPVRPKETARTGPYKAVRVLFLAWESERYLPTRGNVLLNRLRNLFGMTYRFSLYECTLPTTGVQSEDPDWYLMSYLLSHHLLSKSVDHSNSAEPFSELVIVVYSGSGVLYNGRYYLSTTACSGNGGAGLNGMKKIAWDMLERRLASAKYDTLCILNSSFYPETGGFVTSEVRGSNMVLAARGPETRFRREVMQDMKREGLISGAGIEKGTAGPWSVEFLKIVVKEVEKCHKHADGKIAVDRLFRKLVVAHDRHHAGELQEDDKRPFLGFIRGGDAKEDHRVIQIGLETGNEDEDRLGGWSLVDVQ